MKQTNIILMLLIATSLLFASCNHREYRTVTIAFDCNCTPQQQLLAREVINNRVGVWGVRNGTDLIDGKFDLSFRPRPEDNPYSNPWIYLLERILTQRGEIYITEMLQAHELASALNSWISENPDLSRFLRQASFSGLFTAPTQYISYIDSALNLNRHLFPANVYFAWSATSGEFTDFYELFALNSTGQRLPLNPNTVRSSRIEDNVHGFRQIGISLHRDYHAEWARLTRENIGRNLAFVMDGKVLMHPRVNDEITGGRLNITGNLETDDLSLIQSVILGGVLECTARIIEIPNTYN